MGHRPPQGVQEAAQRAQRWIEDSYPSPGRVAWDAWGGDPGERWVGTIDL